MRMKKFGLTLVALLAVAGCDTDIGRTAGLNTPQDAGTLPSDYSAQAIAWTRAKLQNPDAAVKVLGPSKEVAYCNAGVIGKHFGWRVPVTYPAENGCGDCEGNRTMYLWFSHGKIEQMSYFPDQC